MTDGVDDIGPRDAPCLVTLHSLGWSSAMWAPQVRCWRNDYRVLQVDLRGHGKAAAPAPPYTLANLGNDVIDALDRRGITRFDLCGLSLGGQVALWLAAHYPERVGRLIACATAAKIGTLTGWNQRIAAVRAGGMVAVADIAIERFFSDNFRDRAAEPQWRESAPRDRTLPPSPQVDLAIARAQLLATDPQGYIGCCQALRDADLGPHLCRITAPTLLLAGTADISTAPPALHALATGIATSRVVELAGAGHILNRERPDEVTRLVSAHLAHSPTMLRRA